VKVWDLSGNELEVLETGSFKDNQHLQELRLNRVRRLRMVDHEAFVNLTSLRLVQLSHNHNLRYISRSAFVDVPSLTHLIVTDSGLDTLELQLVESLPALTELSVRDNPLTCDCSVLSLLRHVQDNTHLHTDLHQLDVCSQSPNTTLASNQSSENSTAFDGDVYTNVQSSEVTWQSTTSTNSVVLNSTEATAEKSASVQNSRTVLDRCSPRILALFRSEIRLTITDKVRLDCRAVGFPIPTVSWLLPVHVVDNDMSTSHGTQVCSLK